MTETAAPIISPSTKLITDNLPIWSAAIETKSSAGRGSNKKRHFYGIKKLRELILDLAVRGLLVPQDPSDEPASVLLKKIAVEKKRLIKDGKIKKQKVLAPISENEKPFELPSNWTWTRLDNISPYSLFDGDWVERKDQDQNGLVRLIQLADIGLGIFKNVSQKYLKEGSFESLNCTELKENDVLIARLPDPIGRACIFPKLSQKSVTAVDVAILRLNQHILNSYAVYSINSNFFRKQVNAYGKGVTRFRISTGNLKTIVLPIAPLAEQHRIVAKVDELMALCDELEQGQEDSIQTHETLVETLLNALTNATDPSAFQTAWQTIAANFHTLLTTDHSINKLKETILQLAVMGKLVPQNPNDEPASILLKKITKEKNRLIKDGKIKKQKPLAPISKNEKPFELPASWEWVRFGHISIHNAGKTLDKARNKGNIRKYMTTSNLYWGRFVINDDSLREMPIKDSELEKYEVKEGDLLICEGGDAGRAAVWSFKETICIQNHIHRARFFADIDPYYIFRFLQKLGATGEINNYRKGVGISSISGKVLSSIPLPLPPIAEQHRIVAKVDELMTLCDELKQALQATQTTQIQLTDAVVQTAI